MKYKGSCHCGKVAFEVSRRAQRSDSLQLLHVFPQRISSLVCAPRSTASTRAGSKYRHLRSRNTSSDTAFVRHVAFIRTAKAPIPRATGRPQLIFVVSKESISIVFRFSTSTDGRYKLLLP
jgi:hypothetical protein